jgi:hypothetical protein
MSSSAQQQQRQAGGIYSRVSSAETDASSSFSSPPTRRTVQERLLDKLIAAVWVAVACFTAWLTNFFHVVAASEKANRILLQFAAVGFGINTILALYLVVYLPRVKGLTDSSAWEVYCPRVVPIMILTGVVTALLLIRGTWPVWGILSPLILGIEALGCLFALHFVPVVGPFLG